MIDKRDLRGFSIIDTITNNAPSEPIVVVLFILIIFVMRGLIITLGLPSSLMIIPSFVPLLLTPFYRRRLPYSLLALISTIGFVSIFVDRTADGNTDYAGDSIISLSVLTLFILIVMEFTYQIIGYFRITTYDLEISKRKAEAAAEAKANFLSNMSHEIRTPLSGIMGISQMRHSLTKDREERSHLEMILESTDKLLNIVNNVLDYSKIESGVLTFSLHTFSLKNLLSELYGEFKYSADEKNLSFTFSYSGDIPEFLLSDRYKLRTILSNLLQNAITFTDEGAVELAIKRLPGFGETDELLFSVTDTGIGIEESKLETLLTAFEQGDNSLTKSREGIGLGLSVSRRMVEGLGGQLEIKSERGRGSTASFVISTEVRNSPEDIVTASSSVENPKQSANILLADDNKINQTYMSHFLEKQSFNVTIAKNGEEAIEAYKRGSFSVVLMDIQMPVMSGLEATLGIRKYEREKNISKVPIIAVTASVTGDEVEVYKEHDIDFYCPKPVDLQKLYTLLHDVIEQN